MAWTYKCGHTSKAIFLNNSPLAFAAYYDWAESVGVNGTMENVLCARCKEITNIGEMFWLGERKVCKNCYDEAMNGTGGKK